MSEEELEAEKEKMIKELAGDDGKVCTSQPLCTSALACLSVACLSVAERIHLSCPSESDRLRLPGVCGAVAVSLLGWVAVGAPPPLPSVGAVFPLLPGA